MTKTLTEQWREGTLPEGYYYTKGAFDDDIYIAHLDYEIEEDKRLPVEEVLSPVPSYDEFKQLVNNSDEFILTLQKMVEDECSRRRGLEIKCSQLEKKLAIAIKALEHCQGFDSVSRALKEMEGVK